MCAKFKDLTGQIFGRLKVLKRVESNKNGRAVWLCECQCENKTLKTITGKELLNGSVVSCGCKKKEKKRNLESQIFGRWRVIERDFTSTNNSKWICECQCELKTKRSVLEYSLINKISQSCGCLNRENSSQKAHNPIGERFSRLIVKNYYGKNNKGVSLWYCKCDCGGYNIVTYGNLKSGNVKSCGCLKDEVIHETGLNTYIIEDNITRCYTNNNIEFTVSIEDYDKIKKYYWFANKNGYVCAKNIIYDNVKYKLVLLSRFLLNAKDDEIVDHKDRNPLNNTRNNLRIATRSQNNINIKMRIDNTSGVTGVHQRSDNGKWVARLNVDNKRIELGSFDDFNDAVRVRLEAEKIYHKEFIPIERSKTFQQ